MGNRVSIRVILRIKIFKKLLSQQQYQNLLFLRICYPTKGSLESSNPQHFLKVLNKIFQMSLNILPKLRLIFAVISRKCKKNERFLRIFHSGSLFSQTLWPLSVFIFHFCFHCSIFHLQRSFSCIKFATFQYKTCFVPNASITRTTCRIIRYPQTFTAQIFNLFFSLLEGKKPLKSIIRYLVMSYWKVTAVNLFKRHYSSLNSEKITALNIQ